MPTLHPATRIAASLLLAFATTLALAQTAPTKPGTKPAAKAAAKPAGKTLSGKAASGGKLMTRDELRSCLKRLDGVNQSGKSIEVQRPALDREREELTQSGEALKAERADVDRRLALVREWEARMRAHAAEIEGYNKRSVEVQEAPRNRQDAMVEALKVDRERLQKTRDTLAAEEALLVPAYQGSVKDFNEHASARDAKVADWNLRNAAALDAAIKHEETRALWLNECANRPYLEDDETAIKAGK